MNTKIKKGLKTIAVVIVLFCLTVVIINTSIFDEELRSEVSAILKEKAFPPVEGNAYFASLGLMEIYGKDISKTGFEISQYHIENSKNNINSYKLTDSQYAEFFSVNSTLDLFWDVPIVTCDMVYKYDCLSKDFGGFFQPGFNSKLNNPRLQLLLGRFEKIIQMDTFQTTGGNHLVPYQRLRKLGEIQLINKFKNYSSSEFINQLYKDIKFWKMILAQGSSLIDKMVSLSNIRRDVLHLSEFIRTKEIDEDELVIVNKILQQLPSEDIDFFATFETEARFMLGLINSLEKSYSVFNNLLFQPNATSNYHYELNVKPQKEFSKMTLKQFIKYQKTKMQRKTPSKLRLHYLYNPMGKIITEYGGCNCGDYIARGHDTVNMIKLVSIQLQIKLSENKSIINILSKPENLNPYIDKPFAYNKKDSILNFECIDEFQKCEVRF